jgi:hypothetical protein
MLREARNQARLQEAGIPLDNNIENKLTKTQEAQLIGNGGLPNSVPAANGFIPYPTPEPNPSPITATRATYVSTAPATLAVVLPSVTLSTSVPYPASSIVNAGSFETGITYIINTIGTTNFTLIGATSNTIGDSFIATGVGTGTGTAIILTGLNPVVVSPDTYGYYDPTTTDYFTTNRAYQGNGITADTLNTDAGTGGGASILSGIGTIVDTGKAVEPGSFAGSRYGNLIPPQLSAIYTSDILLPATYSVQEAIDEVIRCNCDCWDNI